MWVRLWPRFDDLYCMGVRIQCTVRDQDASESVNWARAYLDASTVLALCSSLDFHSTVKFIVHRNISGAYSLYLFPLRCWPHFRVRVLTP